jgi:hypothetical protein
MTARSAGPPGTRQLSTDDVGCEAQFTNSPVRDGVQTF